MKLKSFMQGGYFVSLLIPDSDYSQHLAKGRIYRDYFKLRIIVDPF
ncbi:hypothetical protein SAMN02745181_0443 [Rubritalea squalenifaciens DSM 18772]|uniref:Uncharacterized protein n=1 Tax=Rubritalea squalenifaciens DSM 18772 TaxID=1123071 RepID=A0A1M6CCU6_9BACT|nr:hypothetical protein SAMN02745181_0443 [Rubritalea squalenifaciens DSM 18772]